MQADLGSIISPWLVNGALCEPDRALIPLDSPLAQYGLGLFSTGRVVHGCLLGGEKHLDRLISDAERAGLKPPCRSTLAESIQKWLHEVRNIEAPIRCKIIVLPHIAEPSIIAYKMTSSQSPVELAHNDRYWLPKTAGWGRLKMMSRAEYQLISADARPMEPLLLSPEGYIVETATSAFWYIYENFLFYPDPSLGGLDSITQKIVVETIGPRLGYRPIPWKGTVRQIPRTGRCYISNSLQLIRPVARINTEQLPIEENERRTLNEQLLNEFAASQLSGCTDGSRRPM